MKSHIHALLPYIWPALAVAAGLYLLLAPSQPTTVADSSIQAASDRNEIEQISLSWEVTPHATRNIEDIRVGDRVLAANPEITEEERATWVEPDWQQWMKLSLLMAKPDGSELEIEMLRPEEWVISQTRFVVEDRPADSVETPVNEPDDPALGSAMVPPQPVYQHLASQVELIDAMGLQLVAVTIEMDLPELGITGDAILVDIEPAPAVESGAGSVVTARFHHSSGDVIDLVLADKDGTHETIGTTTNHPFWSDDRQEYVQAGALESGERVLTYAGDTKRVVSQLARPGPEPVYNLEVHGEHVYFVGHDGLLVHNSNNYAPRGTAPYQIDTPRGPRWKDPITGRFTEAPKGLPGPDVPKYHAGNFTGGRYVNRQVSGDEVFYKYHGVNNRTGKTHNYVTKKKYTSAKELRDDLAILDEWGIEIDRVTTFRPAKGTWISEGTAARQVGEITGEIRPGGGWQGLIDVHNLPKSTVVRTDRLPKGF